MARNKKSVEQAQNTESPTPPAAAPQAPAVQLPAPSGPTLDELLATAATRALTADEMMALQAAIASKAAKRAGGGGGGKPAEPPPEFGSIAPQEAAALKPRLRAAYLAQGERSYTLEFPALDCEKAEGAAVALARKIGAAVMIRCGGADVMLIGPEHGKGEGLPRELREGEAPTGQQSILIGLCARPQGASAPELAEATGRNTPVSWRPALEACERFGYSLRVEKAPKAIARYHLDAVHSLAPEAGEAEGEGAAEYAIAAE